ncbi:MAG: phage tail protein [Ktedonobacterales bacterium]
MATTAAALAVKISVDSKDAESGMRSMGETVNKTGGNFKGMVGSMLTMAGGIGVAKLAGDAFVFFKDQIGDTVKQAMDAQNVMAQTNAVIQSTHGAAGMSAQAVSDLAGSLSKIIPIDDETIQSTENLLLTFTGIHKETFPAATKAALDMSVALGQDTKSSAVQLGKALNDPIKGVSALQKVGVSFNDKQKELIATYMKHGDTAKAQGVILQELQKEFGKAGTAAGDTLAGKLTIAQTQFGNIKETIGNAFLPILSKVLDKVTPLIEKMGDKLPGAIAKAEDLFHKIEPTLKNIVDGIGNVVTKVGEFVNFLQTHQAAMDAFKAGLAGIGIVIAGILIPALTGMAASAIAAAIPVIILALPFLAVAAAIGVVIFIIKELIDHWGDIQKFFGNLLNIVKQAWDNIVKGAHQFFDNIMNAVKAGFNFVKKLIQDDINAVVGIFKWLYDHNTYFHQLVDSIKTAFNNAHKFITDIWNKIKAAFEGALNIIKTTVQRDWAAVVAIFDWLKQNVIDRITTAWNNVVSFISGIGSKVIGAVNDGFINPVKNKINDFVNMAKDWGSNLLKMFIQGIQSQAGALKNAVGDAMGGLGKLMGFHSPAEEGPGADADTWAPNLMKMFSGGIRGAIPDVQSAAQDAISGVHAALTQKTAGSFSIAGAGAAVAGSTLSVPQPVAANTGGNGMREAAVYLDGKRVGRALLDVMTDKIYLGTGGRGNQ